MLIDNLHAPGERRCLAVLRQGQWLRPQWFTDAVTMQNAVSIESARGNDVYWSPASYAEATVRRVANAVHLRAYWLDVDVRAGKPGAHSTHEEAITAISRFIRTSGIPLPTVVASGGGYHLYWALTAPVSVPVWKGYAVALTTMASSCGLLVDTGPSHNPVGLLRPPGSTNQKYGTQVTVKAEHPAVHPDKLHALLSPYSQTPKAEHDFSVLVRSVDTGARRLNIDAPYDDGVPIPLEPLLAGCRQLREAPHEAEPIWRLGLALVAMTEGGDEAAHEWSSVGVSYNEEQVEQKLALLASRPPMPTRCDTFAAAAPGKCDACEHRGRIKSPVMLKYNTKLGGEPRTNPPSVRGAPLSPPENPSDSAAPISGFRTPHYVRDAAPTIIPFAPTGPYIVTNEGKPAHVKTVNDNAGNSERVIEVLIDMSVAPVGHVVGLEGEKPTATVWQFKSPTGDIKYITLENTTLADSTSNSPLLRELGGKDIMIPTADKGRKFAEFLRYYFNQVLGHLPKQHKVEQLGWQGDASFVAVGAHVRPDQTVGKARAVGTAAARLEHMEPTGTLEEWKVIPTIYKQQKNYAAQYALLQSFASPLMALSPHSGMLLHLYSSTSGTGKTTVCRAINSVWGGHMSLMLTANDTANARPKLIATHNSLPIAIDEVTNLHGVAISDLLFAVSQGQEKHRMRSDTSLNQGGTWALMAISTGNESLRDKLLKNKRSDNAAENLRMLEFHMPELPRAPEIMARLDNAIARNNGVAGAVYSQWLTHNRDILQRMIGAADARWNDCLNTAVNERFWRSSLAITEVACALANAAGLIDFDWAELSDWVTKVMVPQQREATKQSAEWHSAATLIDDILEHYQDKTIVVQNGRVDDTQAIVVEARHVAVRRNADTGGFAVSSAKVRTYLAEQSISAAKWREAVTAYAGYQVTASAIRLTSGMPGGGTLGTVRCWIFTKENKHDTRTE